MQTTNHKLDLLYSLTNSHSLLTSSANTLLTNLNTKSDTANGYLNTLQGAVSSAKVQTNVSQIGGSSVALGTNTMVNSIPVTISSNDTLTSSIDSKLTTSNTNTSGTKTSVDTVNTTLGTTNTNLSTINTTIGTGNTSLSSIDSKLTTSNTNTSTTATNVSTVNTTLGTTNTNLSTINTSITSTNTKLDTANTSLTTLSNAVSSTRYQTNISQVGGTSYALNTANMSASIPITLAKDDYTRYQNYVRQLYTQLQVAYEWDFSAASYASTLYKTFFNYSLGANLTITQQELETSSGTGQTSGLCWTSSDALSKTSLIDSRYRIPLNAPCMVVFDIDIGVISTNTICKFGISYYNTNTNIVGFQTNGLDIQTIDGQNTVTNTSWNFDPITGGGPSSKTLTVSTYHYQPFLLFTTTHSNRGVIWGFIVDGLPFVCHARLDYDSSAFKNLYGSLRFYCITDQNTSTKIMVVKAARLMDCFSNNPSRCLKNIFSLNTICSTTGLALTTATTKTMFRLALNVDSRYVAHTLSIRKIVFNASVTGNFLARLRYFNTDTHTCSGGTTTADNSTCAPNINNILTINEIFTGEPTISGVHIIDSTLFQLEGEMDFTDVPTWMFIGEDPLSNVKTGVFLQITSNIAVTSTIYCTVEMAYM